MGLDFHNGQSVPFEDEVGLGTADMGAGGRVLVGSLKPGLASIWEPHFSFKGTNLKVSEALTG